MQAIVQVTATGEEHGLINVVANSVKDNGFTHMTPENKAKMEKQRKEDAKLVEARYLNRDGRHHRLEKPYCRYAGDPIQMWKLIPGYTYTLPKGFIDEINNPLHKPKKRAGLMDASGVPLMTDADADPIHQLIPTKF